MKFQACELDKVIYMNVHRIFYRKFFKSVVRCSRFSVIFFSHFVVINCVTAAAAAMTFSATGFSYINSKSMARTQTHTSLINKVKK